MAYLSAILASLRAEIATAIEGTSPRTHTNTPWRRQARETGDIRPLRELSGVDAARIFDFDPAELSGTLAIGAGYVTDVYAVNVVLAYPSTTRWWDAIPGDLAQLRGVLANTACAVSGVQIRECYENWSVEAGDSADRLTFATLPIRVVVQHQE